MDRSKTGQSGRGLRREANKGKTTRGGEGWEVALDKLMAATALRISAAEDICGLWIRYKRQTEV